MTITFEKIIISLIVISVISVFAAILLDFLIFEEKNNVKKSKKSIVATGTMIGFYAVYYSFIRYDIGFINISNRFVILIGTLMILSGAAANIMGRVNLKGNWANHIKIYTDHKLITKGIYKIVRHPLYASIMLMLLGGSFVYSNWLCAAATAFVFIPFMYYRAKQEETLLKTVFPQYSQYQEKTGMFFPKLWR